MQAMLMWVRDWISGRTFNTGKVYPTLAAAVTVTGAAGANTYGAYVELFAASVTTKPIIITSIDVSVIAGVQQFAIGFGAAASEVIKTELPISTTGQKILPRPLFVPAGYRVAFKTASVAGGSQAIQVKASYVEVV